MLLKSMRVGQLLNTAADNRTARGVPSGDRRRRLVGVLSGSTFRAVLTTILLLAAQSNALAQARPRVGLVLGGGGARGAAHIGVLEVLEQLQIPIDCIAGTSMGALVAGAYAAGVPPSEMRKQLAEADWNDMFVDDPDFSEMGHRSKELARHYLPGSETGVNMQGVNYQSGAVAGQKIKLFINQLVRANQREVSIEKLPLPLSIIATDIGTGERVVFREGSLTMAMRGSMSVPGLMAPLVHQGHKLVDGGLVDNLPINEVRQRCQADVVIAVNVGSPLLKSEKVGSLLTVSAQMVNILTEQNVTNSLASLKPRDIYLQPSLDEISAADFQRSGEAADAGRVAALGKLESLRALSADDPTYLSWHHGIEIRTMDSPRIDEIRIAGIGRVNPAAITRHLHIAAGDTIRRGAVRSDLLRMYGDGYYESVDYTVLSERDRTILRILPVEKSWGPDYLRFGLNLQVDSSRGSTFDLRAAYHNTWLNPLGGELLINGDIGSSNRLGANFHQPIDPSQRYFVELASGIEQTRVNAFQDDHRVAQYKLNDLESSAYAGMNVGLLGPLRFGWVQRHRVFDLDIGAPSLPRADTRVGGWKARLDLDQFDHLYFPTRGWAAKLGYFESSNAGYSRLDADLSGAYSIGNTVLNARLRYTGSPRGKLPVEDAGTLGGFQNLSAFASQQFLGDQVRYIGLRTERIVGRLPLGLRGDMRLGVGLELAQAGNRFTESRRNGLLDSISLYVGGETPFGPAYLGAGFSTSGAVNLLLFIGAP